MKQKLLIEFEMPNLEEMCRECTCEDPEALLLDLNQVLNDEVLDKLSRDKQWLSELVAGHLMSNYYLYFSKRNQLQKREEIITRGCEISSIEGSNADIKYINGRKIVNITNLLKL